MKCNTDSSSSIILLCQYFILSLCLYSSLHYWHVSLVIFSLVHTVLTSCFVCQVLQVNQAGQMIHNGGQQIMVHAVPQGAQTIQVATQSGQALQQIQVVPVSSLQVSGLLCFSALKLMSLILFTVLPLSD